MAGGPRATSIPWRMASFLVEMYVRQGDREGFAAAVEGLRSASAAAKTAGRVRHVRSYLVPSDEMGIHVVDADTADDVRQLAKLAGIEIERVVSAVGVDPSDRPSPGPARGRG
jgi:hypothetical protein